MAIPVWPTSLPQDGMINGYNENYPNNLIRSEASAGVAKVRPKGATPPFSFSLGLLLTKAQRLILRDFVKNTLKDGALRFTFVHPVDGYEFEARIIPDGDNLYTVTPLKTNYMTTLKIEVLP